jgi:nucleotide-binding universal stress UspA family protein
MHERMGEMNVLVAMDGSKYGRWALNWVDTLPLADRPRVTALHVLDVDALRAPFVSQPVVAGNERFIREEIKRMERKAAEALSGAERQMRILKLNGKAKKARGAVAPTILRQAPKKNGLVVVGSQGRDALDRFMLGSVSTNVIHHAPCPVLVVKTEAEPLRRIALAVDGSVSSKNALKFLLTKFRSSASGDSGELRPIQVTVIHVMPFLKYPELKEAGRRLVEEYQQKLIKAGFAAEALCRLGKPADEILKVTSQRKADLVVMGAKGLGAIARFLLGSVSTRVVQHGGASVLVVR